MNSSLYPRIVFSIHGLSRLKGYAFPPFIMIGRILEKVRQDKVGQLVLVAPIWKSQVWYPLLLNSLVDIPLLLLNSFDLILNPAGESHPLMQQDRLRLAAWRVSGIEPEYRNFRRGFHSRIIGMQERDTKVVSVSLEQMKRLVS